MNICFLSTAEKRYQPKVSYVAELFFSTYGLDYRSIQSLDEIFQAKSPQPNLLLVYAKLEDYPNLKEKIPPGCHLVFVSQIFERASDSGVSDFKRLRKLGADFSLPVLGVSSTSEQRCLYLLEEKSGKPYPGITCEESGGHKKIVCYADLLGTSFFFLTLQDEKGEGGEESKGRFPARGSWRDQENVLRVPLVNHYFEILFGLFQMAAKETNLPLLSKRLWPWGSKLAVALTHDVDILDKWSLYVLFRVWALLKKGDLKALLRMLLKLPGFVFKRDKCLHGVSLILEQEKIRDFTSAFFFLASQPGLKTILKSDVTYSIKKAKLVVETILNRRGEVGLHGSFSSYLKQKDLKKEKDSLDRLLPTPCRGIRQHFLYLKVPQTWRNQCESGFLYDCTLGYPDRSGFRSGFALPFRPYDVQTDQEVGIWEINTNVMDQTYDKYDRKSIDQIKREIGKLRDQLESTGGGLLTLLWHTNVLDEFGFPDFLKLYGELLEELVKREAFVSSGENIVRFWAARKEVKLMDKRVTGNLWQWRYQASSPIAGLTFFLQPFRVGRPHIKIDGAEFLVKWDSKGALITLPHLHKGQIFRINLASEES
jgi:hypothetical protein